MICFARFWIKLGDNASYQPTIVQFLNDVIDQQSSSEFTKFVDKHLEAKPFIPHTLISYLFNIISVFVKFAKNPHTVRQYKVENTIDPKGIKLATRMTASLTEQLELCSATCSPQVLFSKPPASCAVYCPHLVTVPPKKHKLEDPKPGSPPKRHRGPIINTTGKRLMFPKGLSQRYCSDFLDSSTSCKHGEACNFVHAVYPSGFPSEDLKAVTDYVNDHSGLSFAGKKQNDKHVS